ncbi:MAG: hypothetical protein IPM82_32225 [Saprospiraceae bacterium]|nr:hypothetical protein [Saprospiraceae bacterium]
MQAISETRRKDNNRKDLLLMSVVCMVENENEGKNSVQFSEKVKKSSAGESTVGKNNYLKSVDLKHKRLFV